MQGVDIYSIWDGTGRECSIVLALMSWMAGEMVIIREVFPRVDLIISGRDKMLSRRCYLNLLGDNLRVPYTVNEIPSECTRAVSMGLGG